MDSSSSTPGRDTEIIIATTTRNGTVIAQPVVDDMKATIRENRIDVVVLDPFVACHGASENDNVAINAIAKTIARMADETNTAWDLVHHSRKTGGAEITVEDGRGASALLAASRSGRVLNPMTKEEATKAGVEKASRVLPGRQRQGQPRTPAGQVRNGSGSEVRVARKRR